MIFLLFSGRRPQFVHICTPVLYGFFFGETKRKLSRFQNPVSFGPALGEKTGIRFGVSKEYYFLN
jgi:hypothetical protein